MSFQTELTRCSTIDLPAAERGRFWLDKVTRNLVYLDCQTPEQQGIEASLAIARRTAINVSTITANAHFVQRSSHDIIKDNKRALFVCFMREGAGFSYQGTQSVHHVPGDLIIYETATPYGQGFPQAMSMNIVELPIDIASTAFDLSRPLPLIHVPGNRLVGDDTLKGLFNLVDKMSGSAANHELEGKLLSGIGNLLEQYPKGQEAANLLHLITRFISDNLSDLNLGPQQLAERFHISTRHLNRIFAQTGFAVSAYIWEQRLRHCRQELEAIEFVECSISEIAFRWGFNDAAHFSRRYRQRYEESPSATRARVMDQLTH